MCCFLQVCPSLLTCCKRIGCRGISSQASFLLSHERGVFRFPPFHFCCVSVCSGRKQEKGILPPRRHISHFTFLHSSFSFSFLSQFLLPCQAHQPSFLASQDWHPPPSSRFLRQSRRLQHTYQYQTKKDTDILYSTYLQYLITYLPLDNAANKP